MIIDEFGELLTAKPDFIELFLSHRPDRPLHRRPPAAVQPADRGRQAARAWRPTCPTGSGLRTLLRRWSPAPCSTPPTPSTCRRCPASATSRSTPAIYERFKAAYVSGPAGPTQRREADWPPIVGPPVKPMPRVRQRVRHGRGRRRRRRRPARPPGRPLMSTVVDQAGRRRAAGAAGSGCRRCPTRSRSTGPAAGRRRSPDGVRLRVAAPRGRLRVPLGLLDDPARQWQGPWLLDLTAGGGHAAGASAGPAVRQDHRCCARWCWRSPSRTRPTEVGIYGARPARRRAAGAGRAAARRRGRRARRPRAGPAHRRRGARDARPSARSSSASTASTPSTDLRAAARGRAAPELGSADVVLLIDGYGQLSTDFEELETEVHDLLARGGRYGIHVVAHGPAGTRCASPSRSLRHPDRAAAQRPGRVQHRPQAGRGVPADQPRPGADQRQAVRAGRAAPARRAARPGQLRAGRGDARWSRAPWTGALPPPVRVLPAVLPVDRPAGTPAGRGVRADRPVENDFTPALFDLFGRDQHLLVLGDTGTGKTNLLRLLAAGLIAPVQRRRAGLRRVRPAARARRRGPRGVPGRLRAPTPTLAQRWPRAGVPDGGEAARHPAPAAPAADRAPRRRLRHPRRVGHPAARRVRAVPSRPAATSACTS